MISTWRCWDAHLLEIIKLQFVAFPLLQYKVKNLFDVWLQLIIKILRQVVRLMVALDRIKTKINQNVGHLRIVLHDRRKFFWVDANSSDLIIHQIQIHVGGFECQIFRLKKNRTFWWNETKEKMKKRKWNRRK